MIQIRLFLLRDNNFTHGALLDLKPFSMFYSLRAVLHIAWKAIFKNP